MKKKFVCFCIFVFATCLFTACSNDDDTEVLRHHLCDLTSSTSGIVSYCYLLLFYCTPALLSKEKFQ